MTLFGIRFLYPFFFILFTGVPFLWFIEYRRSRFGLKTDNIGVIKKSFRGFSSSYSLKILLKTIISILFIAMLANPGYVHTSTQESRKGIDIVILMDISNSMLAEDMKPNRIEAAKKVIGDFISKLKSDRLGFILFAGKPFVALPLTFDYGYIIDFVSKVTVNSINQAGQYLDFDGQLKNLSGTSIGDALIMGADALSSKNSDPKREKVLILVTDGAAETGIHPKIALKYVKERGIKIYSIGIGSKEGVPLCISNSMGMQSCLYDKDTGKPKIVKLDEDLLSFLSGNSGGKYFIAKDNDTLNKIFLSLSSLNKSEVKVDVIRTFLPIYIYFLIPILFAILLLVYIDFNTKFIPAYGVHKK